MPQIKQTKKKKNPKLYIFHTHTHTHTHYNHLTNHAAHFFFPGWQLLFNNFRPCFSFPHTAAPFFTHYSRLLTESPDRARLPVKGRNGTTLPSPPHDPRPRRNYPLPSSLFWRRRPTRRRKERMIKREE